MTGYRDCSKCHGRGSFWTFDRSADGHGGLNGGGNIIVGCSDCYRRRQLETFPDVIDVTVCPGCGQPKSAVGYTECPHRGCYVTGHAVMVKARIDKDSIR